MPYEFLAKNGLISQGNVTVTGSLITSQNVTASNISASGTIIATSFTGSFSGSIGTAINATSASYALSASYAPTNTNITASWATNSLTASYLTPANIYTVAGLSSGYVEVTGTSTIPNTGIYRPAGKTLGLSADGTLILKIDGNASPYVTSIETGNFIVPSGSVGIGVVSPVNKLDINGNISASVVTASFFGTSSWATNAVTASFVSNAFVQGGNSFGTTALLGTNDANSLAFETNGSTRMTINSGGFIGVNTSPTLDRRFNISDTHNGSLGSSSLYIATGQNQNQGLANSANDSGITNVYTVNNFTSSAAIQNQASFNQMIIAGSGSFSGSYRAERNGILFTNTASLDSSGNIVNTYLTNQISSNIPTFSIPNWVAGTQTYVDLITGNSTGSITNLYNHQISSPFPSGGSGGITVTNSYGIYIAKQKTTNIVTNGWGIYQIDTGDLNIFAGKTRIGSTTVPVNTLDVTGNISASVVTASLFFGTASFATNSLTASYLTPTNSYTITNLTASNISASATGSFGIVGIGTTSPGEKLTVSGSSYIIGGTGAVGTGTAYYLGDSSNKDISLTRVGAASLAIGRYFPSAWVETIRFTADGNVGIGTTSPAYKLDVGGTARVGDSFFITTATTADARLEIGSGRSGNGNSYLDLVGDATYTDYGLRLIRYDTGANAGSRLEHKGTGQLQLFAAEAASVTISTTSTERMRIDAGGAVGIGTSTVSRILHAYVTTGPVMRVQSSGSNASIEFIPSIGHNRYNWLIGAQQNISDAFEITPSTATNGTTFTTPAILVASSGNIGIGTTSPTQRLDLSGSLRIRSDGTYSDPADNAGFINYDSTGGIFTFSARSNGGNTYMAFRTSNAGTAGERMRIINDGNVGIGTTLPASKFHISGSGQTIMRLDSDTTTNVSQFQIKAASDAVLIMGMLGGSAASTNFGVTAAGQAYFGTTTLGSPHPTSLVIGNASNIPIIFSTNNIERMRIDSVGNVGIGTTSANNKLEVIGGTNTRINLGNIDDANRGGKLEIISGSVTARQFYVGTNSAIYNLVFGIDSVEKMRLDTNGNVGIGVTSPSGRLHITGSATASETLLYLSKGSGSITQNYINAVNQAGQLNYRAASDQNGHLSHEIYYNGTVKVSHNTYWPSFINNDSYTNGGLGIGTTSTTHGYGLTIAKPSTSGSLYVSGSTIITGSLNVSTNITCLSLTETSTQAVKYNILPLSSQLDNVMKLKPVSFNYKTNDKHSIGLIAEEVAKIYPEFTSENNDSISYGKITSVLIQSIKELKNIIDNQQKQIEDLSNKLKQF